MKKLIGSTMLLLLLGGFASCGGDLNPEDEGNYRHQKVKDKPVMKTIRLQFGGDYVSESDEPLLRAEDGNTYVGINVYRTKKDQKDVKEEVYAYGLFNDKDGISLNVLTGYEYRFEATILIEQEDKLVLKADEYGEPFERRDATSSGFKGSPKNLFYEGFKYASTAIIGDETTYLGQLSSGTAYITALGMSRAMQYPRVKRFYGSVESFDPSVRDSIEISMGYKCFGIKFLVESIPEGTSVKVIDNTDNANHKADTDPQYFLQFPSDINLSMDSEETKTWEGVYSLNDLKKSTKDFRLMFIWDKGNDVTEEFNYPITVTAKKQKVLKLNIDGEVNKLKPGNIILNMEDTELEEENPEDINKDFH